MPFCVIHSQSYRQDEYCVYCGQPQTFTTGGTNFVTHCGCRNPKPDTIGRCQKCGCSVNAGTRFGMEPV